MGALLALIVSLGPSGEIRALGESGDAWNVPRLERIFDESLEKLRAFPDPLFPPDLEDEATAALEALARLDPRSGSERARLVPAVTTSSRLAWAARGVLVEAGDLETVRLALAEYFDSEDEWRSVLSASDDPRLAEFRSPARPSSSAPSKLLSSKLERNLSRTRERVAVRELVLWAEAAEDPDSPRRVLEALPADSPYALRIARWLERHPRDEPPPTEPWFREDDDVRGIHDAVLDLPRPHRNRALRALVETDHPALVGLPMSGDDVDRTYPYLARSAHRPVRGRVVRARTERGRALASLLLSPTADLEEKRAVLEVMKDAWAEALATEAAGLPEAMGEEALKRFVRESEDTDALSRVPLPEARSKLETFGSAAAVESILRRPDRVLSIPFLQQLRTGADPTAARAAELALVSLGAPGSSAFLRRELATGKELESLLGPALSGSTDPELVFRLVRASAESPAGFAALARFHELHPALLLESLEGPRALAERARLVVAISGEPRRLPLLVDLAVGAVEDASRVGREAAFLALAEADLGPFAPRLHRLAGDPDRAIRFRAAAALVPSGDPWTLRLLLGELDPASDVERAIARRAVARLPRDRAEELLRQVVSDGTARSFGVLLLFELAETAPERALLDRLWALVAEDAKSGNESALLAASRLAHPEAIATVTRYLTSSEAAW